MAIRLSYNGALFVREGLGYLLTFQHLIDTSPESGFVFRPLTPPEPGDRDLSDLEKASGIHAGCGVIAGNPEMVDFCDKSFIHTAMTLQYFARKNL